MNSYTVNPFTQNYNVPQANSQRAPRAIVTINGIQAKWIDIEIVTNHFYVSDTFMINLPQSGQDPQLTLQYWALCGLFEVKIYIGFPVDPNSYSTQDLVLFMTGNITDFSIDPVSRVIRIHGRDLSSLLIDKKLTQGYTNLTLSQIATMFAEQAGLFADVELTTEKVGIFFKNDLVILSNNSTQWDLLTALAQLQNFVVYVNNDNLVCVARTSAQQGQPYQLNYQQPQNQDLVSGIIESTGTDESISISDSQNFPVFNGMGLNFMRTPYSSVSVTIVVPYSFRQKKFLTVTATSENRNTSGTNTYPKATPRVFTHKYFGLTREQAQLKATQLLNSYLIHEFELSARLPGDNVLLKNSVIQMSGTGTAFDQLYYPDEIVRRISFGEEEEDGYFMSVNAKNQITPPTITITNTGD